MNQSDKLTISSSLDELPKIDTFLEDLQKSLEFEDDLLADLMLTVTEAATNAILHGNQSDESKQVKISAKADHKYLYISVEDEGAGFDPDSIPDPRNDENLLKSGGRGVFLIREYAEDVSYNDKGNKVTITFPR